MSQLYDFKSYSFIVWDRDENWFTLDRILMDFFHEFGYQNGSGIFHFGGIAAGSGLLLGGWMFFCIVRLLLRLKKLETNDQLLVLLLVALLIPLGVRFAYRPGSVRATACYGPLHFTLWPRKGQPEALK